MGQKVNPIGLRLGIVRDFDSVWSVPNNKFADYLHEDLKMRALVEERLKDDASRIVFERPAGRVVVSIHTGRPGVVIGKKGNDIENLKKDLSKFTSSEVSINIVEIRKPELDAILVAKMVARMIERRVSHKRATRKAMQAAMKLGALGIKISCSGRLGGAEIARTEWSREGRVPLHTLRADIDYATARANTTYGVIGIKVWIYRPDNY